MNQVQSSALDTYEKSKNAFIEYIGEDQSKY